MFTLHTPPNSQVKAKVMLGLPSRCRPITAGRQQPHTHLANRRCARPQRGLSPPPVHLQHAGPAKAAVWLHYLPALPPSAGCLPLMPGLPHCVSVTFWQVDLCLTWGLAPPKLSPKRLRSPLTDVGEDVGCGSLKIIQVLLLVAVHQHPLCNRVPALDIPTELSQRRAIVLGLGIHGSSLRQAIVTQQAFFLESAPPYPFTPARACSVRQPAVKVSSVEPGGNPRLPQAPWQLGTQGLGQEGAAEPVPTCANARCSPGQSPHNSPLSADASVVPPPYLSVGAQRHSRHVQRQRKAFAHHL